MNLERSAIYNLPKPGPTPEGAKRQLGKDYLRERRLDLALNVQAIQAVRVQMELNDPVQRRIRALDIENKRLRQELIR